LIIAGFGVGSAITNELMTNYINPDNQQATYIVDSKKYFDEQSVLDRVPSFFFLLGMGVWKGVAMDSLKFQRGLRYPTFLCPAGGWHAAIFYLFGHPTPYAYGLSDDILWFSSCWTCSDV
jgi:hypothetical protein